MFTLFTQPYFLLLEYAMRASDILLLPNLFGHTVMMMNKHYLFITDVQKYAKDEDDDVPN